MKSTTVNPDPRADQAPSGSTWAADLRASVVVWLVALPLCLGIALASGAPLVAGLISGIVGGLVISWLGGSALLVERPAAASRPSWSRLSRRLGSFSAALLAATAVAGVMQAGLGFLRAGRFAALVPSSVVTGMLAGIGVLLMLQQLPHAVGVDGPDLHGIELLLIPIHVLPHALAGPTLVALSALGVLLLWERPFMRPVKAWLPGPLVAVAAGVGLSELLTLAAPGIAIAPEHRVNLPDIGWSTLGSVFTTPDWSALASGATWRIAATLAIVASLETLLSMQATDRMDPLKRTSNPHRELVGQGIGNTIAGLVGGLPITGVIVRSAANVDAGGRTRLSAFAHGVLLVVTVVSVPFVLERIPLAALAAVLLFTGFKLAHPSRFRAAFGIGRTYGIRSSPRSSPSSRPTCSSAWASACWSACSSPRSAASRRRPRGPRRRSPRGDAPRLAEARDLRPPSAPAGGARPRCPTAPASPWWARGPPSTTTCSSCCTASATRPAIAASTTASSTCPSPSPPATEEDPMDHSDDLLDRNHRWADQLTSEDPEYFSRAAAEHRPRAYFIGCSDARAPLNLLTDTEVGRLFIHRNIANQVVSADASLAASISTPSTRSGSSRSWSAATRAAAGCAPPRSPSSRARSRAEPRRGLDRAAAPARSGPPHRLAALDEAAGRPPGRAQRRAAGPHPVAPPVGAPRLGRRSAARRVRLGLPPRHGPPQAGAAHRRAGCGRGLGGGRRPR
ncbi:MAG: SulP family inorganic anion transporter [Myxococcota bacterium]